MADELSWISPCPGDTIQGLDESVQLHLHLIMQAQLGLHRLRKKQPGMKSFSNFVQLSHKDDLTQNEISQYTFLYSVIIVTNLQLQME